MRDIHYRICDLNVNGKIRPITLYSREDIAEQKELYRRYSRAFMDNTHDSVYSFVPGYSNYDAAVLSCYQAKLYKYFLKLDIYEYYPSMDRTAVFDTLRGFLSPNTADRICRYAFCCPSGISEGSPLSPAISNVYLYCFDELAAALPASFYVRYCDDILLLMNAEPTPYIRYIKDALAACALEVNDEKLKTGFVSEGFPFVGYNVGREDICVLYENVVSITQKLYDTTDVKARARIANGFRAYYRDARCLPLCRECIGFLNRYGNGLEKALFQQKYGLDVWLDTVD